MFSSKIFDEPVTSIPGVVPRNRRVKCQFSLGPGLPGRFDGSWRSSVTRVRSAIGIPTKRRSTSSGCIP